MYIYKNNNTFTIMQNPYDPIYGILDKNNKPYSKEELLKRGFFTDDIPDKPENPKYEYVMKVDFDARMVYYEKIPIKTLVSEETKMDYLTKELATSKLESMKLKGLLKQNSEEIAKAKIEIMKLKGGLE
ncbi:hypothetical protein RSJ21_00315 (plasmid) [Clostridium botulinum]|uniref:hypothetical protein n=1 Tax=Clostridium botulinum TaxID=1491 RepID=UPI000C76410E|nr:hypothetical protein [Clostridium botulinum]AUN23780.1 hypothetical protein RSJ21_00315 [Clostridium botulinum]